MSDVSSGNDAFGGNGARRSVERSGVALPKELSRRREGQRRDRRKSLLPIRMMSHTRKPRAMKQPPGRVVGMNKFLVEVVVVVKLTVVVQSNCALVSFRVKS